MPLQTKRYDNKTHKIYFQKNNEKPTGKVPVLKLCVDLHGTCMFGGKQKTQKPQQIPFLNAFLNNLEENIDKLACLIPNMRIELCILSNGHHEKVMDDVETIGLSDKDDPIQCHFAEGNLFSACKVADIPSKQRKPEHYHTANISEEEEVSCDKGESYGLARKLFEKTYNDNTRQIDFIYIAAAKHNTKRCPDTQIDKLSHISHADKEKKFIEEMTANFGNITGRDYEEGIDNAKVEGEITLEYPTLNF